MQKLLFEIFCLSFILLFFSGFLNIHQLNIVYSQEESNSMINIPETISENAQNMLRNITSQVPELVPPDPNNKNGWKQLNRQISAMSIAQSKPFVNSFEPNITSTKLGNVDILDIKPKNWMDNGKILVYVHGGGYTILGANSTLNNSVPMANATGLRIVSIDYSLAPSSKWNQTTSEIVSVIETKSQGNSRQYCNVW